MQAGVSQEELTQILTQLRSLATPAPAIVPLAPSASLPAYPPQPAYPVSAPPAPHPQPFFPPQPTPYTEIPFEQPNVGSVDIKAHSAAAPVAPTMPPTNIANLFNALLKAGMVSAAGTPTGAESHKVEEPAEPQDPKRESLREYRKAILQFKVELTTTEILK